MVQALVEQRKTNPVWTDKELEILHREDSIAVIKALTGRTEAAIYGKRAAEKGRYSTARKVTREKAMQVKQMWGKYTVREISETVGICESSVYSTVRLLELDLIRNRHDWFFAKDVAHALGTTETWIRNRIKWGTLKADTIVLDTKGGVHFYKINREDLITFIRKYPYEFTGRTVDLVFIVDLLAGVLYDVK